MPGATILVAREPLQKLYLYLCLCLYLYLYLFCIYVSGNHGCCLGWEPLQKLYDEYDQCSMQDVIAYLLFPFAVFVFLCIWGCLPLICIANSTGWKLCRGLTFAHHQIIFIRQSMKVMEVEIKSEWRNWRKAGVYIVLIGVSFLSL